MGIFGDIGNSLLDLGGDWLSNKLIGEPNAKKASERAKEGSIHAFNLSQGAYNKRYQNTVNDMKLAGINPIMAASSGFNVGTSPQMSAPQAFQAHAPSGAYGSTAKNFAETEKARETSKKTRRETTKIINESKLTIEKIKQTIQQTLKTRSEKKLVDQNEQNAVRQFFLLEQQFTINSRQIDKLKSQIDNIDTDTNLKHKKNSELSAQIKKIKAEANRIKQLSIQLTKTANVYRSPVGSILSYINEIIKTITPLKISIPTK